MTGIRFYGWDILRYYWYVWQNMFVDYPWQIYVAWLIVVLSIVTMLALAIKFFIEYKKTNKANKKLSELDEKFHDKIKLIMDSDELEEYDIIKILGDNYEDYVNKADAFIPIITKIHMELDKSYFPNIGTLCSLLKITDYCENNLLKDKDVFNTLQFLCINNIVIMEGRLANYVNHKDKDIRVMARLCYIFCAHNDQYKYLEDELSSYSEMKLMFMHFIFGWMKQNKKPLPPFDDLIGRFSMVPKVKNFLISEKQC